MKSICIFNVNVAGNEYEITSHRMIKTVYKVNINGNDRVLTCEMDSAIADAIPFAEATELNDVLQSEIKAEILEILTKE